MIIHAADDDVIMQQIGIDHSNFFSRFLKALAQSIFARGDQGMDSAWTDQRVIIRRAVFLLGLVMNRARA